MLAGPVPEGSLIWEVVTAGLAVVLVTAMLAATVVVAIHQRLNRPAFRRPSALTTVQGTPPMPQHGDMAVRPSIVVGTMLGTVAAACGAMAVFQMSGWAPLRYGRLVSGIAGAGLGVVAFTLWGDHAHRRPVTAVAGVAGAVLGVLALASTPVVDGPAASALSHLPVTHGQLAGVLRKLDLPPTMMYVTSDDHGTVTCFGTCPSRSHLYFAPGDVATWQNRLEQAMRANGLRGVCPWRVYRSDFSRPETHVMELRKGNVDVRVEINSEALFAAPDSKGAPQRIPVPPGHVGIELTAGSPF